MSTISSEGLAQEQRVLSELCTAHQARLQARGVTAEKLTAYAQLVGDMEAKRAASDQAQSAKQQLTQQEQKKRDEVLARVRGIQAGVKNSFATGSPQYREFHVGEKPNNSTSVVLGWATDIGAAWTKYKDAITASGGILQKDLDDLKAAADALAIIDTAQEVAKKKEGPEATATMKHAMENVEDVAEFVHTVAKAEFLQDKTTFAQFEQARKLRFDTPARKKEATASATGGTPIPTPTA